MPQDMGHTSGPGLERLCGLQGAGDGLDGDAIIAAPAFPGIERIEARFGGNAFAPHRHDTYALGMTLQGIQTFTYRGEKRYSLPGNIIVLHPDELHDGGAGSSAGLRYRMLYLEPSLLLQHQGEGSGSLPFVREPVLSDDALQAILREALEFLDAGLEDLFVAELVQQVGEGLSRHAERPTSALTTVARRQAFLARDYLAANADRQVSSQELEAITGLDRYALSRHFRALFATSPHRFLLMRRLQGARKLILAGTPLADIAAATGFADQSHLNRHFKKAFGLTPGRWADLLARP